VLKRLNSSICCLCWIDLGGPEESCVSVGVQCCSVSLELHCNTDHRKGDIQNGVFEVFTHKMAAFLSFAYKMIKMTVISRACRSRSAAAAPGPLDDVI